MPAGPAFRIPRAHKDRVRPRQLIALAATCVSVGVALSGVLAAKQHKPVEHEYAWQSAAAVPAFPVLEEAQQVIEAALAHEPPAIESSVSAATSAAIEAAAVAKKPGKTAKATLVRGAVTYHCDGRSDCQPDRVLEARVWRVLARLASCRGTSAALGYADLKLWFEPSASTRVVFAASAIASSLNLRAVGRCVARDLSKLRATRKADRFELSLSFGLVAPN